MRCTSSPLPSSGLRPEVQAQRVVFITKDVDGATKVFILIAIQFHLAKPQTSAAMQSTQGERLREGSGRPRHTSDGRAYRASVSHSSLISRPSEFFMDRCRPSGDEQYLV